MNIVIYGKKRYTLTLIRLGFLRVVFPKGVGFLKHFLGFLKHCPNVFGIASDVTIHLEGNPSSSF